MRRRIRAETRPARCDCYSAGMTDLLGYALLVEGICLVANLLTGLLGRVDPERRLQNAVPAAILAVLAFVGYAALTG